MPPYLLTFHKGEKLIDLRNDLSVATEDLPRRVDSDLGAIDESMRLAEGTHDVERSTYEARGYAPRFTMLPTKDKFDLRKRTPLSGRIVRE